jgi:hypothetical protein
MLQHGGEPVPEQGVIVDQKRRHHAQPHLSNVSERFRDRPK